MVEVTQEDRNAAANIWRHYVAKIGECLAEKAIRSGANDDTMIVQAFAAHAADTRAKVITLVESGMYSEYGRPQPDLVKAIRALGEQP